MTTDYCVPRAFVEVEVDVKKSRFIARADFAATREDALNLLKQAKLDYPDARHHCWAYYIGNPLSPSLVAFSDDGEPGGTAGRPILNVLEHKQIGDIMLVVIRYFGGIKLGAGGLVRAYSQAAQLAIDNLSTKTLVAMKTGAIEGDFKLEQVLRHWLEQHQGLLQNVAYDQPVTFRVQVPMAQVNELEGFVLAQGGILSWADDLLS